MTRPIVTPIRDGLIAIRVARIHGMHSARRYAATDFRRRHALEDWRVRQPRQPRSACFKRGEHPSALRSWASAILRGYAGGRERERFLQRQADTAACRTRLLHCHPMANLIASDHAQHEHRPCRSTVANSPPSSSRRVDTKIRARSFAKGRGSCVVAPKRCVDSSPRLMSAIRTSKRAKRNH